MRWSAPRKSVKTVLCSLTVITLLVIGSSLVFGFTLSSDTVNNYIVPKVEERLGSKVKIGKIEVSLFSGIRISEFSLANPKGFSPTPLLEAKRIQLNYRLIPLLWKKVIIDSMQIIEPAIFIERSPEGRYNFSDLGKRPSSAGPPSATLPPKSRLKFQLAITEVRLEEARINLNLARGDGNSPYRLKLENVKLKVENISREGPMEVNISLGFPGTPDAELSIQGTIAAKGGQADLNLRGNKLRLQPFFSFLPEWARRLFAQGLVGLDLQLSAGNSFARIASEGTLQISGLNVKRGLDLLLTYQVSLQTDASQPRSRARKVSLVRSRSAGRILTGALQIKELSLEFKELAELNSSIKGKFLLTEQRLAGEGLELKIGSSGFKGSVVLETEGKEGNTAVFSFFSDLIDLDQMAKFGPEPKARVDSKARLPSKSRSFAHRQQAVISALKFWKIDGNINAAKAKYQGLSLKDVRVRLKVEELVANQELVASLAGGRITYQSRMELSSSPIAYRLRLSAEGVEAGTLISALFPRFGFIKKGQVSLDLALAGRLLRGPDFRGALSGDGSVLASAIKLGKLDFLRKYKAFLNPDRIEGLEFSSVKVGFRMDKGKAWVYQTEALSAELSANGRGTIDLVAGKIDYNLEASMSPAFVREALTLSVLGQLLSAGRGWVKVPLTIKGDLSSPKLSLSRRALPKKIQMGLRKELEKRLPGPSGKGVLDILEKLLR
ncbi:MAG: AsmA family protein [Thermodesulfobacteriota bacterium]